MKKGRALLRGRWRRFRGLSKENQDAESQSSSSHSLDWEDLVMDKTEVPVFMVFTILLNALLLIFALDADISKSNAFLAFISLTTIGFGDIVPENHDYIVLMLAYLGIGLAVTTMCIDLVGIQYIQKIHYFGRKFRGTDLLHLLKRKRMIERRLAMGQGEEILQMYIQQMQSQLPDPVVVEQQWEDDKTSSHLDYIVLMLAYLGIGLAVTTMCIDLVGIQYIQKIHYFGRKHAQKMAFTRRILGRVGSVHLRALLIIYRAISSYQTALSARRSRRLRSCPSGITVPPSQSVRNRSLPESARHQPRFCTQHDPLLFSPPLSFRISEPFMLSKLAVQCDSPPPDVPLGFESPPVPQLSSSEEVQQSELSYPQCSSHDVVSEPVGIPRLQLSDSPPPSCRRSSRFCSSLFPIAERRPLQMEEHEEQPAPLMKRKKRERLARLNDPLHNVDWLNVSPRVMQLVKEDLPKLFEHVRNGASSSSSIVLVSPRTVSSLLRFCVLLFTCRVCSEC
ncbi:Ion channel [Ancylostoma ceylanicum]|uniref:Ion channel n=1 Tax=Ancylostoma ceylanicum TaxID=53326 RepID=A0A0D6L9C5_9BILA|nr:Ion channel [Ancylostoma ceylanicum]